MRRNVFLYSFLILISGVIYSESSFSPLFLISGICLASAIAEGYLRLPLPASAVALLICFKGGSLCGTTFLFGGILPGVVIGAGFRKKLPFCLLTVSGGLCFIAKWVLIYRSYYLENGSNIFEDASGDMLKIMKSNVGNALALYGMADDEKTTTLINHTLETVTKFVNILVPATLIIFSCTAALIIIMCAQSAACKRIPGLSPVPFSEIYAPRSVLIILLVSLLGSLYDGQGMYFSMNIFFIAFAYVFICGISIIDFFLKKRISAPFLRFVIYLLFGTAFSVILPQIIYIGVFAAGVSDILFDYRHIRVRPLPPAD